MIVNGVDLSLLDHEQGQVDFPTEVKGRVAHIDADFLAYMVSYEKPDDPKDFDDMKHNAEEVVENLRLLAAAEHVHMHLTPKESNKGGRYDIAMLKQYQGNREDKAKPRYLHIMRTWLAERYPGTLHLLCEADDGMSSSQYAAISKGEADLSVIVTKDKDLRMVPGWHLNWDTGSLHYQADEFGELVLDEKGKIKGYGRKFFWAQMLMGDTADNISGIPVLAPSICALKLPTAAYSKARDSGDAKKEAKAFAAIKPKKVGPKIAFDLLAGVNSNRLAFVLLKECFKRHETEIAPFRNYRTGEPITWQQALLSEMSLLWMRVDKDNPKCFHNFLKEECR